MDPMKKNEFKDAYARLQATYRSLPTDELLGELKNVGMWAKGFMRDNQDDKELTSQGLVLMFPFVMEILEALYPKLEVLYGIHATSPKDEGATRKQMVNTLLMLFEEKKVP